MHKTPVRYVFLGLLIGAIGGAGLGAANGDVVHGISWAPLPACSSAGF